MSHVVSSLIRQLPTSVLRLPLERATFLPTRLRNALIRGRLATVLADLERLQDQDLLKLRNIGEDSVVALILALRSLASGEKAQTTTALDAGATGIEKYTTCEASHISSSQREIRIPQAFSRFSLEDETLLEDAYSVISPGESLPATEVRRRLAESTGDAALQIVPNRLRKLLAGDSRFAIGPGGTISLADIPVRRNPFDAVAS